jgi:monoamine oxidase
VDADVLVIGAGAAGLTAAAELEAGGVAVLTLEARKRTGGRVWSVHDPRWPVAVELGGVPASPLPCPSRVRTNAQVLKVRWTSGCVEVASTAGTFKAQCAIVAVPPPVLTALIPQKRSHVRIVEAIRVAILFREAFWEDRQLNATSWSAPALHVPVLVGQFEGRAARNLSARSREYVLEHALEALGHDLSEHPRELARMTVDFQTHDWKSDPFAQGAFVEEPDPQLAEPLDGTLFFAGEATEPHTSEHIRAAIESGRRAAREALPLR